MGKNAGCMLLASFMHRMECNDGVAPGGYPGCRARRGKDGEAMAGRRIVGLLVLLVIIIAVAFVIWYIGSQKTVYDIMLSYHL
jgi:hypothetical protein